MPVINGKMYWTKSFEEALSIMNAMPNTKCLFVGDSMGRYDDLLNQYGIIPASILMPDLIGMEADINGAPGEFRASYFGYLNSEGAKSMIVTIITALYRGKNIVILVPPEAEGLNYPTVLMDYLFTYHGITVACSAMNIPNQYNVTFDLYNADCMYAFNFIGAAEYLYIAGPGFDMINKLCFDTHMQFVDTKQAHEYYSAWQSNMVNAGMVTIKPFGFSMK